MLSPMLQHIEKRGQKPLSQLLHCSVVSLAEVIIESKSRKTKKKWRKKKKKKDEEEGKKEKKEVKRRKRGMNGVL